MAARISSKTTLALGLVRADIGLYKTKDAPPKINWEQAGPNGGALRKESRAVEKAPEDSGNLPEVPVAADPEPQDIETVATSAPGEYKDVLIEDGTEQIVEPEDVRKGFFNDDGKFYDCTDQIAAITERTKLEEMRIVGFIPFQQVPNERVTDSYFIGAQDDAAPKVLRLLMEAMLKTQRAAVVKWTKSSKQSVGIIKPRNGTLVVLELAWSDDWRNADDIPKVTALKLAEVAESEVASATALIDAMKTPLSILDDLRDDAREQRDELVQKALAGEIEEFIVPDAPEAEESLDLGKLLKESEELAATR